MTTLNHGDTIEITAHVYAGQTTYRIGVKVAGRYVAFEEGISPEEALEKVAHLLCPTRPGSRRPPRDAGRSRHDHGRVRGASRSQGRDRRHPRVLAAPAVREKSVNASLQCDDGACNRMLQASQPLSEYPRVLYIGRDPCDAGTQPAGWEDAACPGDPVRQGRPTPCLRVDQLPNPTKKTASQVAPQDAAASTSSNHRVEQTPDDQH